MNALMSILFVLALMIVLPMSSEGASKITDGTAAVVVQPH